MEFFVYILYSPKCDRYYIGYSENPLKRLEERHNRGLVKATSTCYPYTVIKLKSFQSEKEAINEEHRIKMKKSRKYILQLINGNW